MLNDRVSAEAAAQADCGGPFFVLTSFGTDLNGKRPATFTFLDGRIESASQSQLPH
jgi:hypothetical protein